MNINQLTRETQWGRIESELSEGYYLIVKVPTSPSTLTSSEAVMGGGGRVTSEGEVE